jgi:hypothetical protein
MKKQRKHLLALEVEYDYEMYGLCSHHSDYRLVWNINDKLNLKLEKSDQNFVTVNKKGIHLSNHSLYEFIDTENLIEYFLIKNKNEGKFLIPEKPAVDYFLFLRENYIIEPDEFMVQLNAVSSVLAVFEFSPQEFTSTENLVFN